MELYQLKTFVAVAEEGHLTRAAERLHTSQPAVSAQIKALEEELGLTLFERTSRGMKLTGAGVALRVKAEAVLQAADAVRFEAAQLKEELSGEVHLGLNIESHYLKTTELLLQMRQDYPGVQMHYLQKWTWEAPEELRAGRLDAAFVYDVPQGDDFLGHTLQRHELVVVAPLSWEKQVKGADWQRITTFPWVWTHGQCPMRRIAARIFEDHGSCPLKAVVVDQESTLRAMVSSGVGLSLMSAHEARDAAAQGQLFIAKAGAGSMDLSLIYLRKRANDPLIQALLRGISRVWGAATPDGRLPAPALAAANPA